MSMETWKPRRFVEEFQKRAGLLIDGKPGPQTQIALELVPELPPGRFYPPAFDVAYFGPDKITAEQLRKIVPSPLATPAPIDPADIRPGDVVRVTQEFEVEKRGPSGTLHGCSGEEFRPMAASQLTWHLVHRPDPDAEAVEALREASWSMRHQGHRVDPHQGHRVDPLPGLPEAADMLSTLRESGWDVVRRAES